MSVHIIDVRLNNNSSNGEADLHHDILRGLSQPVNQKTLPHILLYDEEGLRIYDQLATDADEYYLFPAEENLLKNHAHDIAKVMYKQHEPDYQGHVEGVVLELGAG
jgi:L-histidine Nalpha-methyltransferase / hercynylcysteine S-oxide synthase